MCSELCEGTLLTLRARSPPANGACHLVAPHFLQATRDSEGETARLLPPIQHFVCIGGKLALRFEVGGSWRGALSKLTAQSKAPKAGHIPNTQRQVCPLPNAVRFRGARLAACRGPCP